MQRNWQLKTIIISSIALFACNSFAAARLPTPITSSPDVRPSFPEAQWYDEEPNYTPPRSRRYRHEMMDPATAKLGIIKHHRIKWLTTHGVYVGAKVGMSVVRSTNISDDTSVHAGLVAPAVNKQVIQDTEPVWGLEIGYDFYRYYNTPVRIALAYMHRNHVTYDPNPIFDFTIPIPPVNTMQSNISTYNVMAKVYYDWHLNNVTLRRPWVIYVEGGIGGTHVRNDYVVNFNGIITNSARQKSSFAWEIGAGINMILTKRFVIGLGYQYENLGGPVEWRFPNGANTSVLRTTQLSSNTILVTAEYYL